MNSKLKFPDLSKNKLRKISSLKTKKGRKKEAEFIAEGLRLVKEGLDSNYKCELILVTHRFMKLNPDFIDMLNILDKDIRTVRENDFPKITDTKNPQGIAAVFKSASFTNDLKITSEKIIALEKISEPGNLGTILRNCAWFGFDNVLLSSGTADVFNPKVLRASMGAVFHLNIFTPVDFYKEIGNLQSQGFKAIYTDLRGENIFMYSPPDKYIMIFSNEANGPSPEIKNIADGSVTIPRIGNMESLNVASASAVILAELTKDKVAFKK